MSTILLTCDAVPKLLRCLSARLMRDYDAPLDDAVVLKRLNAMIESIIDGADDQPDDDALDYEAFFEEYEDAVSAFIESIDHLVSVIARGSRQEWWPYRFRILNPYGDVAVEHALRQRHDLDSTHPPASPVLRLNRNSEAGVGSHRPSYVLRQST